MSTTKLTADQDARVMEVMKRITKAIGKEEPIIVAHACLRVIELSSWIEGAEAKKGGAA